MEPTQKNIDIYVDSLTLNAKRAISDSNIESRVVEIATKYSLSSEQKDSLLSIVTLVMAGVDTPEELEQNIKLDLSVSDIVAEQIVLDLENRVFEYALNTFAGEKESLSSETSDNADDNLPEIRPDNLPMVETNQLRSPVSASVPNYTPRPKVVIDDEPVQSPISVPRFKAVPLEEEEIGIGQNFIPNIPPKPSASGIMDAKLNTVTGSTGETKPPQPAPQKYTVDPYREPIN